MCNSKLSLLSTGRKHGRIWTSASSGGSGSQIRQVQVSLDRSVLFYGSSQPFCFTYYTINSDRFCFSHHFLILSKPNHCCFLVNSVMYQVSQHLFFVKGVSACRFASLTSQSYFASLTLFLPTPPPSNLGAVRPSTPMHSLGVRVCVRKIIALGRPSVPRRTQTFVRIWRRHLTVSDRSPASRASWWPCTAPQALTNVDTRT